MRMPNKALSDEADADESDTPASFELNHSP
jgi:hypothetical protein